MRARPAIAGALTCAALLLGACGGSDEAPKTGRPTTTSTPRTETEAARTAPETGAHQRALTIPEVPAKGGKDGNGGKDRAQPPARWSAQAERLCAANRDRARSYVRDLTRQKLSRAELARRALAASPRLTAPTLARIDALPPPRGREARARAFTDGIRATFPLFEQTAAAIGRKDRASVERLGKRLLNAGGPLRAQARELGIEACIPRG
jgi:hypothetical protein